MKLVVYTFPTVDAGADKTISVGSSVDLSARVSADAKVIKWQPSVGLSCNDCKDPVANPKKTTSYKVIAINEGGCISTDETTVFVICNNGNIFFAKYIFTKMEMERMMYFIQEVLVYIVYEV